MAKKLTPYEKTVNFIHKQFETERDKWNAGLPNNMDEWESFEEYFDLIDVVSDLKKDNAELRCYNERLINEMKRKTKFDVISEDELKKVLNRWKSLLNKELINSKEIVIKEINALLVMIYEKNT